MAILNDLIVKGASRFIGTIFGDLKGKVNGYDIKGDVNKTVPADAVFTDTTYNAGTGVSLSGTTINNSGVRSITSGSTNGTISVNTNGTSAEVAVKGLGSAAYTASTAYAAASHGKHVPDTCTTITDWNSATTTGWYMSIGGSNAPTTTSGVWYFGKVIAHNTKYLIQEAWQFTASTNGAAIPHYIRACTNSTWGSWTNITVQKAVPSDAVFTDTKALTSMTGVLPVANGGTGKTTAQEAENTFLNALGVGSDTPKDADYFISQYAGGGTTNTNYYRRPVSTLWTYIKSKLDAGSARKVAIVGSDTADSNGWYKVASGTLSGYSNNSLLFAVHSTDNYKAGILQIDLRCNNTTAVTVATLNWLVRNNLIIPDNYIIVTGDNSWVLYQNVTTTQYYRTYYELLEYSGTSSLTCNYTLHQNVAKESTAPTATKVSSDTGIVMRATQDSVGQQINTTYIKGLSVSGKTITYTKGDNTTGTITTQDTTYTSLKSPYSLTIQGNGTTLTNGTYDGSAAKTVNITPASIGASATSHTHNNMTGATASAAGGTGFVPAPAAGKNTSFLRGDGTWVVPTNTTYSAGTGLALNGTTFRTTVPRVAKSANSLPGTNTCIVEEYNTGDNYNLPSSHWYHIYTAEGNDAKYATQLALGMTTSAAYYRNYNADKWGAWKLLSNTASSTTPKANGTAAVGVETNYARGDHVHPLQTTISGNAGTATKLATARTISLSNDFQGSASFDGSGNATLSSSFYSTTVGSGTTSNYPYHRIAKVENLTASYADIDAILMLRAYYNGGPFGIIKISVRTNNTGTTSSASAKWMLRSGYSVDDISIGLYDVFGSTYADIFLKTGAYARTNVYQIAGDRKWTLVKSTEASGTTASDKLTSTEVYSTIASAGTEIHSQAYSTIITAVDSATVANANNSTKSNTLNVNRVTKNANITPTINTSIMEEYNSGDYNLPTNNGTVYQILTTCGHNANYATQLALSLSGDKVYFRGYTNGTWATSWKDLTPDVATTTSNGLMSATDKTKLDLLVYETGTFTPTVTATVAVIDFCRGKYTRIGNFVDVYIEIWFNYLNHLEEISGLPYTPDLVRQITFEPFNNQIYDKSAIGIAAYVRKYNSGLSFKYIKNTISTSYEIVDLKDPNDCSIAIYGSYMINNA